jgi:hypothetical protein
MAFPAFAHAQFRGGSRSFGPRGGGMTRGFSGFRSAPAPIRTAPARSARFRGYGFSGASVGWTGFGRRPGPSRGGYLGRRRPTFGRRIITPLYSYPAFYPFFEYPSPLSYVGFASDYEGPQEAPAAEPPAEDDALVSQVQALTDEVAELRDEQGNRAAAAPAPQVEAEDEPVPAVLVYRDGRQLEARNFAIYGQSVWVFGNGTTRKVALADLNLDATRKLNDQRGVSFTLPATQ